MKRHVVLLAVLLAVTSGACTSGEVEGGTLSNDPPWGLDGVEMPETADEVEQLIDLMPEVVGEAEKGEVAPRSVAYFGGDNRMSLNVNSIGEIREFAGSETMTLAEFLTLMLGSGELQEIEASQLDEGERLVWASASVLADGQTIFVASWGQPDGEWGFNVEADTPQARTALIHAFVETVKTTGG